MMEEKGNSGVIIAIIVAVIAIVGGYNLLTNSKNSDKLESVTTTTNTTSNLSTYPSEDNVEEANKSIYDEPEFEPYCEDVTSYNYDWDDDMLCYEEDGSTFYTSYEGAEEYINNY